MKLKHFGTDGIRGEFGGPVVNERTAYHAGRAAVGLARSHLNADTPKILIGRDTRASGAQLFEALANGISAEGGEPVDLGIAPTPSIAKMASVSGAALACSLTASHNPCQDNGLKFFLGSGTKLTEELELDLDNRLDQLLCDGEAKIGEDVSFPELGVQVYEDAVVSSFDDSLFQGVRIALDCANGALSEIAPRVFSKLGATIEVVGASPDGANINLDVGSEHPESLKVLLENETFDLGFAFDGDGDRMIAFDASGIKLPGEAVMAILAMAAKSSGQLSADTLVTTVQSNFGLDATMKENGINVKRVDVGDKHIARLMLSEGYKLGGEESGHLIIGEFSITGDGLFAALKLASVVLDSGRSIKELASVYNAFPQVSKSLMAVDKPPLESCSNLQGEINRIESELGDQGRLLIRYSGTEPKLRLLVEASDQAFAETAADRLVEAAGRDLELR